MVRLKAAWAAEVIESASSRIMILKGGHGLPLNTNNHKSMCEPFMVLAQALLSTVYWQTYPDINIACHSEPTVGKILNWTFPIFFPNLTKYCCTVELSHCYSKEATLYIWKRPRYFLLELLFPMDSFMESVGIHTLQVFLWLSQICPYLTRPKFLAFQEVSLRASQKLKASISPLKGGFKNPKECDFS